MTRGVLIDYKRWADRNAVNYSPFEAKRITVKEIETIGKEQGVEFRTGDVFIIRSGFTEALGQMSAEEQKKALSTQRTCGVEGTEDSARWFWNKHFAAVAGDAISFEAYPPIVEGGREGTVAELGMPHATTNP